jgi:hypothetical protein
MPQKIKLKKDKPSADTLYVSSKNDPRLKAYQDSLQLSSRKQLNPNPKISVKEFEKRHETKVSAYKEKGIMPIAMRDFSDNPYRASEPVFAKPKRPVVYKEEEKKIVETKEPESVVPIREEVKTMQYTGDPVYHHTAMGDKGIIGFIKDGTLTKIFPEDFDRFAVPKETRQLILNKEAVDKFMESRLGKYYKR